MQNPIALAMIVAYLAGTTLLGILMVRRSRRGDDWAVAGGRMGVLLIAVGIAGTRVGGAATYGVAGNVITGGVWNLWYGVNTFLALTLVGIFFAVPYRRLGIQTVGEVFVQRFNSRRCQWLTSLCVQIEYLIVNIIEPYVIGRILAAVTGMSFGVSVLLSGVLIVTYTALGGIWGSAATNLIHCLVILVGLTAVGLIGLNHLGGWTQVTAAVGATLAATDHATTWWSIAGAGWLPVLGMFFAATMHTPAASVYCNFAAAGRDERTVKRAFILGGLIAAPMPLLAGLVAIERWRSTARRRNWPATRRSRAWRSTSTRGWAASPWRPCSRRSCRRAAPSCCRAPPCSSATGVRPPAAGPRNDACGPIGGPRSSTAWARR